ncbi:hypothetical protein C8K36_101938 [Rhodococcus sp. OK519]|uniref:hypothetical protein n=1 Tax=Rhodococcus sp. OK519 TaxID=2135729 RepID=UPI000D37A1F3|nr:hypothetical protein C8K36_101938 [Rhodococcus sp. OK519]
MTAQEIRTLVDHIAAVLPHDRSHWPSGWPQEAEAALLDAIFSARATYGTPTTGVRRVIGNWRTHRDTPLDDLTALAAFVDAPDHLSEILDNRQRVPGNYTTKAEAAALAAAALVETGIRDSGRIRDGRTARDAILTVPGLGDTTWESFVLQLSVIGPDALTQLCRFVSDALGSAETLTETRALELLAAAATESGTQPGALLNAAWRYQRTQRPTRAPKSLSA